MMMTMVRMRMISSLCFQLYIWQHPPRYVFVLLVQNSWHLFHYRPFDRPPHTSPYPPCQSGHVTSPSRKFPPKAKSGNEIVKSDTSPPPKSPKMCGLFLPKQQKDSSSSGISVSQHLPPVPPIFISQQLIFSAFLSNRYIIGNQWAFIFFGDISSFDLSSISVSLAIVCGCHWQ